MPNGSAKDIAEWNRPDLRGRRDELRLHVYAEAPSREALVALLDDVRAAVMSEGVVSGGLAPGADMTLSYVVHEKRAPRGSEPGQVA